MGRKEFYEQMEELKLLRSKILNQFKGGNDDQVQIAQAVEHIDSQADRLKLLQNNKM
jgi:hypothetical protein